MPGPLATPMTRLFKVQHPVMSAGMASYAGPELAAAVTNAGGLGVFGGAGFTPKYLRSQIAELKEALVDKNAPFGVDLLLPQVGGGARKTNSDYTKGTLPELIDIIIEEKAALFVTAIGIPPQWAVDKLHAAGIPCMNMVGAVKHIPRALSVGVDMICAQGGEGGGHTGDVSTMVLIAACAKYLKGKTSAYTKQPIILVAAGGIHDGRGLAAALALGASAVWVGTRFVCAEEAGASERHQKEIISAGYTDTIRTVIFSGRPLRVKKTKFILDWEARQDDIKRLADQGIVAAANCEPEDRPFLMGTVAAVVEDVLPAKKIVDDMVNEAAEIIKTNSGFLNASAKL